MKSKKRLAIAAMLVLILAIAAVCIFAVRGGDEPVPETATSAPSAATAADLAETAAAAQAEETSEPMAATFSPEEVEIIDGIEIDVLPDDETADEQTLEEQYSDFTDATISLPVVP